MGTLPTINSGSGRTLLKAASDELNLHELAREDPKAFEFNMNSLPSEKGM
jgi:hypothetical protein